MKIGILTFHSQLNYGGVLQCWALQTALEKMGHKVVVIDRWMMSDNWLLERGYNRKRKKWWIQFWIRSLLGLGDIRFWLRVRRTKAFLRRYLHLTPYHFVDWKDAPRDLGVDMIVVGSDQVWHCWPSLDVRVYLLEDAPKKFTIAYAASFGMERIPAYIGNSSLEWGQTPAEPAFKAGLARFAAISCREMSGVRLCRELGFDVQHVVDPVLLLERDRWRAFASTTLRCKLKRRGRLVCYFLRENVDAALPLLSDFARKYGFRVDVFVDVQRKRDFLPAPLTPRRAMRWLRGILRRLGPVRIRESAGPMEFVRAHASADCVLTDSFHSLMFSIVFGKNVRIVEPVSEAARSMFSRIEEFAAHMSCRIVVPDVGTALASFTADAHKPEVDVAWLDHRQKESIGFLRASFKKWMTLQ